MVENTKQRLKRIAKFRAIFRFFKTNKECSEFVREVLNPSMSSIGLWRCKKRLQPIPQKKLDVLMVEFFKLNKISKKVFEKRFG
jgi:hypothetical protein